MSLFAALAASAQAPALDATALAEALAGPCGRLATLPWPRNAAARRVQIDELELARSRCMTHAGFLATLGGLLLEDGDTERALIWLERSLLLDPDNPGALSDHALALAAKGEPAALDELAAAWRGRTDIPPALRARLYPDEFRMARRDPPIRLGGDLRGPSWGLQREVSLLVGHESNLDQSPRLNELTLTLPDGALVLPVTSEPRRGLATLAGLSLQGAYSGSPGVVLRSGLSFGARSAPSQRQTDWHHFGWTATALRQGAGWRAQLDAGVAWVGGPLSESYRLYRLGASAEMLVGAGCRGRVALDGEFRRQTVTESFNSASRALSSTLQCPMPGVSAWSWALALRGAQDRPETETRPGGTQRQWAGGLRVFGPAGAETRIEANLRVTGARDGEGYSDLLSNGLSRRLQQQQFTIEAARRLPMAGWEGAEAVLQWQNTRQRSNLPIFNFRADNLYGGLRWLW